MGIVTEEGSAEVVIEEVESVREALEREDVVMVRQDRCYG